MQNFYRFFFSTILPVLLLVPLSGCQQSILVHNGQFITVGGEFASTIKIDPTFRYVQTISFQRASKKQVSAELYAEVEGTTVQRILLIQTERVAPSTTGEFFLPVGDTVSIGSAQFTADESCIGTTKNTTASLPEDTQEYTKAVQGMGLAFPQESLTRRWFRIAPDKKSQLVIMYAENLADIGRTCTDFNARIGISASEWKQQLLAMDLRGRAVFSMY